MATVVPNWLTICFNLDTVLPSWKGKRHLQNSTRPSKPTNAPPVVYGESQASRTIYTVVSLVCMLLLAAMIGFRAKQPSVCHSAIVICLTFYVGSKATMYTFLVERAHAMKAPYMRRTHDWIWLGGMFMITTGFGSIAICGFLWPIADLSPNDGRCRIGLPIKVTVSLLTFDITINMALTGTFIYLLRPLLRFGGISNSAVPASRFTKGNRRILKSAGRRNSADVYPLNQNFLKAIKALLRKSIIGSVLVMLPTVGNLAALYSLKGRELGWLCLTICTFDGKSWMEFGAFSRRGLFTYNYGLLQPNTKRIAVTWAVVVIHWLTVGSTKVEERALAMLVQPDTASNASAGPAISLRGYGHSVQDHTAAPALDSERLTPLERPFVRLDNDFAKYNHTPK
ncbi:hypothetical protein K469DRAFT_254506 [Zopfia rhizophila CBS 207.26]|uniref:Uncharacterized protein n=1 Tax=Zopfia rhizophila CBS 207.26 TaxID=1314779 RepID=A0A6A6DUH8_9PEZI|nr:hypothetical protein K469DRAFT_254506 [Zopfia rhizophila CBS 207.26]